MLICHGVTEATYGLRKRLRAPVAIICELLLLINFRSMSRRFPHYQQLDKMDCGPTCLRMVAAYHGRAYSLNYLREHSYIERDGVSLYGIVKAAETIGLTAEAYRLPWFSENEADLQGLALPVIVHWKQEHFVVVYRITTRYVLIGDPDDKGLRKLTHREFLQGWCSVGEEAGIVLLLNPTPAFYDRDGGGEEELLGWRYLLGFLRPYRRLVVQLAIGLLGLSVLQLLFPFLTQAIVDIGINNRDIDFIYLMLAGMLLVFLGEVTITLLQGWILLHLGTRINVSLVAQFLRRVMGLPLRYFDQKTTGDFLQRIYDQRRIEVFLTNNTLSALFSFVSLFVLGGVLWWYHTGIFLVFLGAAGLYLAWVFWFLKRRALIDHQRFREMTANQNTLIELVQGMPEIKLQQSERKRRLGWVKIQNQLFRTNTRFLTLTQYQDTGAQFISQLKDIIIIVIAAQAVITGELSLGAMLAIQYIVGQLNVPLRSLVSFLRKAQDAKLSLERLGEIQQMEPEATTGDQWLDNIPTSADLVLEDLTFGYSPLSGPVLKGINLQIPHGQVTAIVGASGSGKTTLIKLLLGFYQPDSGRITLGDYDLQRYAISSWRSACGAVLQDGFLFSDTIAANIAESSDTVEADRLLQAVRLANLQDYVQSLPQQFQTKIGPQGNGISQGQRQRLLIARAIYKDPSFLFFDEATNALDAENEKTIVDNLEQFYEGRTVVVVAHRLSTVRNADKIVVLEQGEILEEGTHAELVAKKGRYLELISNQLELGS